MTGLSAHGRFLHAEKGGKRGFDPSRRIQIGRLLGVVPSPTCACTRPWRPMQGRPGAHRGCLLELGAAVGEVQVGLAGGGRRREWRWRPHARARPVPIRLAPRVAAPNLHANEHHTMSTRLPPTRGRARKKNGKERGLVHGEISE